MDNSEKKRVLSFWFLDLNVEDWYKKDSGLDHKIKSEFLNLYHRATRGELFSWRKSLEGRLAEIIVLDQFSRNIFRNDPRAFQYDCMALTLSQEVSILEEAKKLEPLKKAFLYMPYMHSESLIVHREAVKLFSEVGLEENLKFELKHKEIIEKFGRYPHRNETLGRISTELEMEFIKLPGSSF